MTSAPSKCIYKKILAIAVNRIFKLTKPSAVVGKEWPVPSPSGTTHLLPFRERPGAKLTIMPCLRQTPSESKQISDRTMYGQKMLPWPADLNPRICRSC